MSGFDFIQDLGLVMLIAAAAAWLCQRAGLPVVLGYIIGGILIGPHTHAFPLVAEPGRIQSLAQVGLVFLIFNIGQGIRLQQLRKVGLPLVLATLLIAVLVLAGCRLLGVALGWPGEYALVLAGILMVSSTAVLGKSLRDANALHSGFGQTALTVTALDDLMAVVMLTVVTSLAQAGQTDSLVVFGTVIRLKAVIVTMVIGALLLVPPLLQRMGRGVSSEVRSLVLVGVLLAMAFLSAKAGFSAALGAFLLGVIVSSTGRVGEVERVLGGLCEVFAPVFFVAIGMLFDFRLLAQAWPLVAGVFLMAVVWRTVAATGALLLVGQRVREAARAGLCLTPIGEFSLIIALAGVQGGLVPEGFYAVAIGVCLLTSLTTPLLIRRSHGFGVWVERHCPARVAQWVGLYHNWLAGFKHRRDRSWLWKVTGPRLVQMGLLILFISGLIIMARPLFALAGKWLGGDWPVANGLPVFFWLAFGALLLAPGIALWRQMEALAMMYAEFAARGHAKRAVLQPLFEKLIVGLASLGMLLWLAALVPYAILPRWGLVVLAAALAGLAAVFWRRLIHWQSWFEIELRHQLADGPVTDGVAGLAGWPEANGRWDLSLAECVIAEHSRAVARPIFGLPLRSLFGCTIVSIERQRIHLPNPAADTVLYPGDRILLLGREENLAHAQNWLEARVDGDAGRSETPALAELRLDQVTVPAGSRHVGKSLAELAVNTRFGVQIVGLERNRRPMLSPGRTETLQPGDQLLVLGAPQQTGRMELWLAS